MTHKLTYAELVCPMCAKFEAMIHSIEYDVMERAIPLEKLDPTQTNILVDARYSYYFHLNAKHGLTV
jgi:hypothetical protein